MINEEYVHDLVAKVNAGSEERKLLYTEIMECNDKLTDCFRRQYDTAYVIKTGIRRKFEIFRDVISIFLLGAAQMFFDD